MDSLRSESGTSKQSDLRPDDHAGEINLAEIVTILWRAKWIVASITAFCAIAACIVAIALPNKYEATVLMSVAADDAGSRGLGSISSMMTQLGGLASLAGISTSGNDSKAVAQATLQSEALTERYVKDRDLLPILYSKLWDAKTRSWTTDDPAKVPTVWKANELFKHKIRDVSENSKTGLVTMTITWTNAQLAAQWANDLVRMTNDYLREKAISEAERNIAYLKDQVTHTNVLELQQAIYSLMENEIKKEMMARGSAEYALKVIDPATVPEKHSSPKRLFIAIGGLLLGGLLSATFVLIRHYQSA